MECSQGGALVPDDQEICPACGGQIRKRSLWQRVLQFLAPGKITRTKVIRTSTVENLTFIDKEIDKKRVFYSLDEIPPELRAKFEEAKSSGQGRLLRLDEIPSELRAKFEQVKGLGEWQLLLLDEMPPELRAKFEKAKSSGQAVTEEFFSYQGPDGKRQVFHSFEEVPPELRAKLEEAKKSGQGVARKLFSYEGPDGQKHTYHSLEEMPPDIQAVFQENLPQ